MCGNQLQNGAWEMRGIARPMQSQLLRRTKENPFNVQIVIEGQLLDNGTDLGFEAGR